MLFSIKTFLYFAFIFFIFFSYGCSNNNTYTEANKYKDLTVHAAPILKVEKLPDLVCYVNDTGLSKCIRLKDMVAPFDNAAKISTFFHNQLADIGLNSRANIALMCGNSNAVGLQENIDTVLSSRTKSSGSLSFKDTLNLKGAMSKTKHTHLFNDISQLSFSDRITSFSNACKETIPFASHTGTSEYQQAVDNVQEGMSELVAKACDQDNWSSIRPVKGKAIVVAEGIVKGGEFVKTIVDTNAAINDNASKEDVRDAASANVPDTEVFEGTTADGHVKITNVNHINEAGDHISYGQSTITKKENPFDSNEISTETGGYCIKTSGGLCNSSDIKEAKKIADAAEKKQEQAKAEREKKEKEESQPATTDTDGESRSGSTDTDNDTPPSEQSECGADDCVDSCESYTFWWSNIQERCELSNWQEYYCQQLVNRYYGCPDSSLIYPDPDNGYTCGKFKTNSQSFCDSLQGIMICPEDSLGGCTCAFDEFDESTIPATEDICSDPRARCLPEELRQ